MTRYSLFRIQSYSGSATSPHSLLPEPFSITGAESTAFLPPKMSFVHPIVRNCGIPHSELASQSAAQAVSLSCQDRSHLITASSKGAKYPSAPAADILHYPHRLFSSLTFSFLRHLVRFFVSRGTWQQPVVTGANCTWHSCVLIIIFVKWSSMDKDNCGLA